MTEVQQQSLWHLIGIGGIGMSGLARILLQKGYRVSGSDQARSARTEALEAFGADIHLGHDVQNIPEGATVVYSSAVGDENPELQWGKSHGSLWHRSELLDFLMADQVALTVAGTHGKTSTSALLAHVLQEAGTAPSYAIGGILAGCDSNAAYGDGRFFVAEADESDGSFLVYRPAGAILTNVDADHLDHYGDGQRLNLAFETFLTRVQDPELLFYCGEDATLARLCRSGHSYGFHPKCELQARDWQQQGWQSEFQVFWKGQFQGRIRLPVPGRHAVLNALGVYGLCRQLGLDHESIARGMESFPGVGRRCERIGETQGVLILDDYAHHPVEVATTLSGLRQAIEDRPMWALFQPHRYSRTRDCLGQFGSCFEAADRVIITDIYAAGEGALDVSPTDLVEEIRQVTGMPADYVPFSQLQDYLFQELHPMDTLVTLGAGDVTRVGRDFFSALHQRPLRKRRVALCFGGESSEHEISKRSARFVSESLPRELVEVQEFFIDRSGAWQAGESRLSSETLKALARSDLVFPVLHGPMGEDGSIQGFFEVLGLPYVGGDFRSNAMAMDKVVTKRLASEAGIAVAKDVVLGHREWRQDPEACLDRLEQDLGYPLYVKPPLLGSSVGVARVADRANLELAIEAGWSWDDRLLVEREILGRQLEFAVLGHESPVSAWPGEIVSAGAIYDYKAKYGDHPMQTKARADVSEPLAQKGKELALRVFRLLGGSGMARVDFFLTEDGDYLLNEVNPIPGFTEISLYPQCWMAEGMSPQVLVERLMMAGLRRQSLGFRRRKVSYGG